MTLSEIVGQYVAHKQSMGMRFSTEQRTLKSFCRAMGDIAIADVEPAPVLAFIAGTGPVTRFWHRKREVLVGFYRFATTRSYCLTSPLPTLVPKPPQPFVPYIYSHEELRRLLQAHLAARPAARMEKRLKWLVWGFSSLTASLLRHTV